MFVNDEMQNIRTNLFERNFLNDTKQVRLPKESYILNLLKNVFNAKVSLNDDTINTENIFKSKWRTIQMSYPNSLASIR